MKSAIAGLALLLLPGAPTHSKADERSSYLPSKVAYDVSAPEPEFVHHILDRASLLENLYGNDPFESAIVLVIHEETIALLAKTSATANQELIDRARSLTLGGVISIRLCKTSARMQGFDDSDFPEFIELVPMADAELVKLQNSGYAYLR